jgi:flagellin-like hook-associated protein FlgL
MGAMDNVMTAQNNVLTGASMAYSTAYGNVMNADMAQETANLASAQVQRDGATAMLAQANGMNKEIVAFLLKSVTN